MKKTWVYTVLALGLLALAGCNKKQGDDGTMATATPIPTETPTPTPFVPENPDKMPTEDDVVELELENRLPVFGQETGTDNSDGSVTFAGGNINKCMFSFSNTVNSIFYPPINQSIQIGYVISH